MLNKFTLMGMLGFSSGLPFLLCFKTLQVWLTDAHVGLETIGLFSIVLLPYSLKFTWAPIMDRTDPLGFGRRKSWLLITQVANMIAIFLFCLFSPEDSPKLFGLFALLLAIASSSQDIVIDGVRRELFDEKELGLASTFTLYGYRIALWITGGATLFMATTMSWHLIYFTMGLLLLVGIVATLLLSIPEQGVPDHVTVQKLFWDPLKELLRRPAAFWIISFVLIYKVGDVMAGSLLNPYYLAMGYTKVEIGFIAKTLGLAITLIGSLVGGLVLQRYSLWHCLIGFGILQALSNLSFVALSIFPHSMWTLGSVIVYEDFCQALGTVALMTFMALMTNKKFSATQYAVFSSLTGLPRSLLAAPAGYLITFMGWTSYFTFCTLISVPGLLLVWLGLRKILVHRPAA